MKKLQKIRLINWHRFSDETIFFGDSVLISGENGAGKSTLLDAIQLVITCSKNHFNKAAHDKGRRTLNTYMRCKTGREDKPFERTGELTSHIALEFYDEARKQPFIVGAVMDSASEEKEPNIAWYLLEKQELEDSLFLRGSRIKSISEFRSTNKKIRTFATTQNEARKMMAQRFGRLEDKFFSLIPKALAFRPIHDIKDFVYSYVLDEKEVNIDSLRQNVRGYQDLERMLQDVKVRIAELEKIAEKERDIEGFLRVDRNQAYYLAQADVDMTRDAQKETAQKKQLAELNEKEEISRLQHLEKSRSSLQDTITTLKAELMGNEQFRTLSEYKRQEAELKEELTDNKRRVKDLLGSVRHALAQAEKLMAAAGSMQPVKQQDQTDGRQGYLLHLDECIVQYAELLRSIQKLESLAQLRMVLEEVLQYKKQASEDILKQFTAAQLQKEEIERQLKELRLKIAGLEKKRLTYPAAVTALRDAVKKEFVSAGRSGDVRILCEMLEITNPAWQNAVEGYLNTQRFHLLVEPENFDLAISVYDRLREQKKVFGAGLINTGRLEQYDTVSENSLAEVVTSKSIWAKRYINMVLGKVTRCQSYQELKKYPTSITRQCMRYQNHVVSAIKPEIYQTPYIGAEAYVQQLKQCRIEEQACKDRLETCKKAMGELQSIRTLLDTDRDIEIKFDLHVLEEKQVLEQQLSACKAYIERIEQDTTIIHKQIRLEELTQNLRKQDEQISVLNRNIGAFQTEVKQAEEQLEQYAGLLLAQESILFSMVEKLGDDYAACRKEYERLTTQHPLPKLKANYESSRKANWTRKEKAEHEMVELMHAYKTAHDFGAAGTLEGYPEFDAEYHKLKDSQLLTYEEKVQKARQAAEEEFREQFLSRLQENIKQAQGELKELNRALQDIHFSHERYIFRYDASKKLKKYYDMIMDDFNLMQGESIFSGLFRENHREVIDELFEKLALSDESEEKILEEYTDYRSYMDYDIEIRNDDGSYMLYSKVSREKSGGETQTPFYITVAASFMQLYRNSIGGDSIGIVMMDEAFNNMDDERISGVLQFMTGANLQVVIAAPPEKIQYIAPAVQKVLLVLADDRYSYVEDFTQLSRISE